MQLDKMILTRSVSRQTVIADSGFKDCALYTGNTMSLITREISHRTFRDKPAALTFDCYGTLINWIAGAKKLFQTILKEKNAEDRVEQLFNRWLEIEGKLIRGPYRPYKQILSESLERAIMGIGLQPYEDDGKRFVASIREWQPFPEVPATLHKLKTRFKLGVISNIDKDLFVYSAAKLGIHVDFLTTAEDVCRYKPSEKPFYHMLNQLELAAPEVAHCAYTFGTDLVPAKRLGFKTVWVKRVNELNTVTTDYTVRDLFELERVLM